MIGVRAVWGYRDAMGISLHFEWEREDWAWNIQLQGGMSNELELINRWIASDKSTRIPISTFQLALQLHGVEVDVEEVECMLANMVYRVSPSPLSLLFYLSFLSRLVKGEIIAGRGRGDEIEMQKC